MGIIRSRILNLWEVVKGDRLAFKKGVTVKSEIVLTSTVKSGKKAWLIDLSCQLILVWQGDDLPLICSGVDILPALGILPELTVDTVMAMIRRQERVALLLSLPKSYCEIRKG